MSFSGGPPRLFSPAQAFETAARLQQDGRLGEAAALALSRLEARPEIAEALIGGFERLLQRYRAVAKSSASASRSVRDMPR